MALRWPVSTSPVRSPCGFGKEDLRETCQRDENALLASGLLGDDGSAIVGDGETFVAIDFSGDSGADGMLVMTGPGSPAGDVVVEAGGHALSFKFLTAGEVPVPRVSGNDVRIGRQTLSVEDGRLVLGEFTPASDGT